MQDLRGRVMDLLDDPSLEAVKVVDHVNPVRVLVYPCPCLFPNHHCPFKDFCVSDSNYLSSVFSRFLRPLSLYPILHSYTLFSNYTFFFSLLTVITLSLLKSQMFELKVLHIDPTTYLPFYQT